MTTKNGGFTPTKPGWYWYRWDALGDHFTPVFCDRDGKGNWFVSEATGPESEQPIGYIGSLEGTIVGWIGEGPSEHDVN